MDRDVEGQQRTGAGISEWRGGNAERPDLLEIYRQVLTECDMAFFRCRVLLDDEGRPVDYLFLETNPRFEEFTGLANADGKTGLELVPDLESHWIELYGRVALTGGPVRLQEGSAAVDRWWEVHAFRVGEPEDLEVAAFFRDLTESHKAEKEKRELARALETERARLMRVFDKAPAAIATLSGPEHRFEMANPIYRQLVGHRELLGKTAREAFPELADEGFFELLDNVYASGEAYVGRGIRVPLQPEPDAEPVERYLDFVYTPLFGPNEEVTGIFAHAVDVTEHKLALKELARAHDETERRVEERTRRLSSLNAELMRLNDELESFTYSVSHDLRAPLRGIDGFTQVLQEDYGHQLDETALSYLERVRAGASRIGSIIDSLLSLSRLQRSELKRVPLNLTRKARETIERLRQEEPDRVVDVRIEPGVTASGDSDMLRVVLENLLGNAWKFTRKAHEPTIEFGVEEVDGQHRYFVRDTGAGFEGQFAHKLFLPFQRLHAQHEFEGTGIGLATVQRVIERHGGKIWAEGEPGKGAAFYFTLGDD
ncbi:MAG TPA: ATP-binding protein [Trueperaceae bacterium]